MPDELSQADIDALLTGGGGDFGGLGDDLGEMLGSADQFTLPDFNTPATGGGAPAAQAEAGPDGPCTIETLYDVDLDVKIELGRTYMPIEDILRLREGSVIQLEKDAGAPVDILINGRIVAQGEVLVLNDYFCVRVTEILSDKDRAVIGA